MPRLGLYTGKLYGDDVPTMDIHECARVLYNPTQELIDTLRSELSFTCKGCRACEEARKSEEGENAK